MAYLAKRMFQGNGGQAAGANPDALSGILGQEQQDIRQQGGLGGGLLGAVLDQDGDGQLGLGDLMKIGGGLLGGRRCSRSEGYRGIGFSSSPKISPRTGATSRAKTTQHDHTNSTRLTIRSHLYIYTF